MTDKDMKEKTTLFWGDALLLNMGKFLSILPISGFVMNFPLNIRPS